MPDQMTLRNITPILEVLVQSIKLPQVAKSDMICRKKIADQLQMLGEIDFESAVIETHSFGEIGRILADKVRNQCAEIVCRIHTFNDTYSSLDKRRHSKSSEFDEYEINYLFRELELLQLDAQLYKGSLIARGKMQLPDGYTINDINQELFRRSIDDHREKWLSRKRKFLESLRKSIEFAEFLDRDTPPLYNRMRDLCNKLFIITEQYFPPCEILLNNKLIQSFIQRMMRVGGSYIKAKVEIKESACPIALSKKCWEGELFPMMLVSKLYEVCADVFDNPTESQFYSSLNLHGKYEPMRIKPKQTIKACYLVSKLYEIVPAKHKTAWREDILNLLGIEWSYYEKKYCHPRGSDASASSRAYADEVDEIFKEHKKRA